MSKPKQISTRKLSFEDQADFARKRKVKKTYRPKFLKNRRNKDIYDMTLPIRGRCLIIANSKFLHLGHLNGYISDSEILEDVFTQLHFKVTVLQNLSAKNVKKKVEKLSKCPIRNLEGQPNAFVVIILSHGTESKLMGADFESEAKTPNECLFESDIVEILNNENCKYLQDRPKLIFIQACQGRKDDEGVNKNLDRVDDVDYISQDETDDDTQNIAMSADIITNVVNEADETDDDGEMSKLPNASDIMICYSTISGYKSYVHKQGSVFGIALATALINHAHDTDLQSLLNKISAEMKRGTTATRKDGNVDIHAKQIPEIKLKGWTKKLYFNPGYPKQHNPLKRKAAIPIKEATKKVKRSDTTTGRKSPDSVQIPKLESHVASKKPSTSNNDNSTRSKKTRTSPISSNDLKKQEKPKSPKRRNFGKLIDPKQRKITEYPQFQPSPPTNNAPQVPKEMPAVNVTSTSTSTAPKKNKLASIGNAKQDNDTHVKKRLQRYKRPKPIKFPTTKNVSTGELPQKCDCSCVMCWKDCANPKHINSQATSPNVTEFQD